ncbi:hypothetical protein [Dyadobacter sp. OTU695]|uniref:hypothetical protein n=1 Tax=Dyadobacter sp. OTU695 TaxID=3043860 RepID=UPI00313ECB17
MHHLPEGQAFKKEVAEVLYYDDLYRKQLARRKYIQENRMLPEDEPVKSFRKDYHIPAAGVELGQALGNLSKNVSVWKKRVDDPRYPEAEQKHAMYVALYNEAKTAAAAERARIQSLANDSNNHD